MYDDNQDDKMNTGPDADKENKKMGNGDAEPAGFSFLSQKGMSHLKR